jgi:predicted DNA binding CopG/RHH family protein
MQKYIHIKVRVSEEDRTALNVKTAQQGTTIQEVLAKAVQQFLKAPRGK